MLQSCPTLCNPTDGSPPGSPVPGILQARTLEWVAISFSNAWKWKVKVKSLSRVRLLATAWTAAHQAPPSLGFSRQEDWSGVPLPSPFIAHVLMKIALFILPALQDYSMEYTAVCIQSVILVNFRLFTFYLLVKFNDSMDNLLHMFLGEFPVWIPMRISQSIYLYMKFTVFCMYSYWVIQHYSLSKVIEKICIPTSDTWKFIFFYPLSIF